MRRGGRDVGARSGVIEVELDSQDSSSIKETIQTMQEIDEAIDEHGGWSIQ